MGKWSTRNIQVADKTTKNPIILAHLPDYTAASLNSPAVKVCTICFNIAGLRILPTRCICLLCVTVTINANYFAISLLNNSSL